jgi:hypothetical protein
MQTSHFHKQHDYVSEISIFEKATAVMRLFCLLVVSGQSKLQHQLMITVKKNPLKLTAWQPTARARGTLDSH